MIKRYKKKPVIIEAVQFTGINSMAIVNWATKGRHPEMNSLVRFDGYVLNVVMPDRTLRVVMPNDFVIKGEDGWFDVWNQDNFTKNYEEAA